METRTITASAAACLYAGVVTDTGRFQYEATSPETLRLAAELRTHPFDHARLAQALFEDNTFAYLRVLATALGRLQLDDGAGLAWTYLTQADVSAAGIAMADTDDLIDTVQRAVEPSTLSVWLVPADPRQAGTS